MAQVKIPGIGPVDSKWALAGGALIVGVAGFAWYRHLNAPTDPQDPAAADFTQGSEVLYGDAGDMAFATDYAYDGGAYPYPTFTTPSYGLTTTTQTAAPVTNSEWTQRSIEHLELVGVESQTASLAVSRYLLKECLTATQADIVRQAVAGLGPPPQGTFSIVVCATPPTTTPPPSTGGGTPGAVGAITASSGPSWIRLDWPPTPGADGYAVDKNGSRHMSVVYSVYTAQGLKRNTSYRFAVRAIDGGKLGPARTITVRTKR